MEGETRAKNISREAVDAFIKHSRDLTKLLDGVIQHESYWAKRDGRNEVRSAIRKALEL